jgi:predicted ribosome quality control (RQC) complex YloA/Tae2 family protein
VRPAEVLEAVSSKGRPYRSFTFEGFEILVGKAATDNDHLTFNVAQPNDLWLHVAGGTPGSHVVIRNPERGAIPEAVTQCAATLAAWYSKARNAARVEVHVCRAGDVKKARGAPAGQVQIARFKSVRVAPAPFAGEASEPE